MSDSVKHTPRISILMPTYNKAGIIGETIRSILDQTFTDFEFLICDDGSPDHTLEVLASFDDPRIRILKNETNQGIGYTRNKLIDAACGEFLAFMDHDDICLPEKYRIQIEYMDAHPECDALSCALIEISGDGRETGHIFYNNIASHEEIRVRSLYTCAVAQNTLLIRHKKFKDKGLRYTGYKYADDMHLYCRALDELRFTNLTTPLYKYRYWADCSSQQYRETQISEAIDALILTHRKLGVDVKEFDRELLSGIHLEQLTPELLPRFRKYSYKLLKANRKNRLYDHKILKSHVLMMHKRWAPQPVNRKNLKVYLPYTFYKLRMKFL